MNLEQLQILVNIYNNLREVSTKGDSSFILVDSLRELQKFIMQADRELTAQMKQEERHE